MNMNLQNKTVVYTGAAGLIGQAAVLELLKAGAKVALVDVDAAKLEEVHAKIKELDSDPCYKLIQFSKDISSQGIDDVLSEVKREWGTIDCLVNAAYPRTSDWHKKFEDIPFESWQKNVDLHLNGYFLWSQRAALIMKQQQSGHIINFSSTYGLVGPQFNVYKDVDNMTMPAAYAAIKGGITNFTRYMASYLGPEGIRVNAICPGGVFDSQHPKFVAAYVERTPLRRMASVEDIAGPILFLVSDLSKYMTGVNLAVDGGWTAL